MRVSRLRGRLAYSLTALNRVREMSLRSQLESSGQRNYRVREDLQRRHVLLGATHLGIAFVSKPWLQIPMRSNALLLPSHPAT